MKEIPLGFLLSLVLCFAGAVFALGLIYIVNEFTKVL